MRRFSPLHFGFLGALGAVASASLVLGSGSDVARFEAAFQRDPATVYDVDRRNETSSSGLFVGVLRTRQNEGRCGTDFGGQRCGGNQCCSAYGYCGSDQEHCAELVGCQPQYGRCGDAPPETTTSTTSTPTPTPAPTTTSSSTPSTSSSTQTSSSSSSSSSPPLPTGTLIPSTNGLCGNSTTCAGSGFGNCCSEWYWCGSSTEHCGTGCRLGFGNCGSDGGGGSSSSSSLSSSTSATSTSTTSSSTPVPTTSSTPTPTTSSISTSTSSFTSSSTTGTSTAPSPTSTVPVSTDGRCGENQRSCTGSTFGRCCSDYGWCGNEDIYCRVSWGCQPQWGSCGTTLE